MEPQPAVLRGLSGNGAAGVASFDVEIELPDRVARITVRADESILDAARRAGLLLPSMCEQGWCTRCAARVLEGEVDQSESLRYYDVDRAAGFALLCTGRPRSRLRLRSHEHAAMLAHRLQHYLPVAGGGSM